MFTHSFPAFCANIFLCRWDKALINITLCFALSLFIVHIAKTNGLLLLPHAFLLDIATSALATAIAIGVGIFHKFKVI